MNPALPGLYAIAGIVLTLLGLFGIQYGAALFFWPLAIICFSLILYPTLFGWGLITGLFTTATCIYIGFTIIELIKKGGESTIFSDGIFVYLFYLAVIITITTGLYIAKPTPMNHHRKRKTE